MQYAYAYQLNGTQAGGLDPSAKAYINAVVAAGATVNSTQRNAINNFYKTGKSQGWYVQLKRMFLPIWGIAAPNAIGMISGSSGTFNGTVTHAAGYVQGNGSTGYFDFGSTMPTDSLTFDNGLMFVLCKQGPSATGSYIGASLSASNFQLIRASTTTNIQGRYTNTSLNINGGNAMTGILTLCSQANNLRSFRRRASTGASSLATSSTETSSFSLANFSCYAMARNSAGSLSEPINAQLGSYGYSLKMSDSDTDLFTLALKNLWESCTGLSLP
jgi:hypothetical protein